MSKLHRITLVVQPPTSDGDKNREFYDYDKFVDQLRGHTSAAVELIEDDFQTAPAAGLILLDGFGAVAHEIGSRDADDQVEVLLRLWTEDLRRRIFCLGLERGRVGLAMLERLGLAGALDQLDYRAAINEGVARSFRGEAGLYGLRSIAEELGPVVFPNERYCKIAASPQESVCSLLARYLESYSYIASQCQ
jgi:hypothetical protein